MDRWLTVVSPDSPTVQAAARSSARRSPRSEGNVRPRAHRGAQSRQSRADEHIPSYLDGRARATLATIRRAFGSTGGPGGGPCARSPSRTGPTGAASPAVWTRHAGIFGRDERSSGDDERGERGAPDDVVGVVPPTPGVPACKARSPAALIRSPAPSCGGSNPCLGTVGLVTVPIPPELVPLPLMSSCRAHRDSPPASSLRSSPPSSGTELGLAQLGWPPETDWRVLEAVARRIITS